MSFEYSGLIFRQSCLSLAKCVPHLTKTHVGVFTFVDFAYCASIVTCQPAYGTTWSCGGILIKWIVKTRKKTTASHVKSYLFIQCKTIHRAFITKPSGPVHVHSMILVYVRPTRCKVVFNQMFTK